MITKVYFPRLIIPAAPVLAAVLDLAVSLVALVALMLVYGVFPTPAGSVLLVPSVLMMLLTAAGVGCWLAALNIQYRDVKYVVPFLLQLWMYASPVVYPLSLVPSQYRLAYAFNPLAGAIAGFRAALLGTGAPSATEFGVSLGMAILVFAGGAAYFRRTERVFADVA